MRTLATLAALIVGLALAELLVPGKAHASLLGDEIFASGLNLIPPSAIVRDEPPEEAPGFVEFTGVNGLSGPHGAVQIDFDGDNSLTISTNGVSWCCGFGDYVFSDLDFLDGNIITGFSLVSNVGFSTEGPQRTTFLTEFSFTADSITLNFDEGLAHDGGTARFLIETARAPGALDWVFSANFSVDGNNFSCSNVPFTVPPTGGRGIFICDAATMFVTVDISALTFSVSGFGTFNFSGGNCTGTGGGSSAIAETSTAFTTSGAISGGGTCTNEFGTAPFTVSGSYNANAAKPGKLSVSPTSGLVASGDKGGPFSPPSQSYTLMNTGGLSIVFDVSKDKSWVSLSRTGGTLLAGASTNVLIAIDSNAALLKPGVHSDTVSFTNTTNGQGNTSRSVSLTVNAPPIPWIGLLLLDD